MLPFRRSFIKLIPQIRMSFGGHHAADDHHHVSIPNLDRNQSWIRSSSFASLEGFEDLHTHEHHDDTDPYAHLVGRNIISFERIFFSDPYYHEDSHEDLMNQPHGYLTNDDPLDTRNTYEQPALELIFISQIVLAVGLAYGIQGMDMKFPGDRLYEDNLTAEMLEDEIRKLRVQTLELENRKNDLKQRLE